MRGYYADSYVHALWNICVFGVVVGVILIRTEPDVGQGVRPLAIASLIGVLVLAAGWPVIVFLQGLYDFYANARYGLPLLPVL